MAPVIMRDLFGASGRQTSMTNSVVPPGCRPSTPDDNGVRRARLPAHVRPVCVDPDAGVDYIAFEARCCRVWTVALPHPIGRCLFCGERLRVS